MKICSILICIQLFLIQNSIQVQQLKISIYYESLSSESAGFIRHQLYPTYQKIGPLLCIDFVPYGKATIYVHKKWKFKCHHGSKECWGNKAQACGLSEEREPNRTVSFVNCVMSQPNPATPNAIKLCAPKLHVLSDTILGCTKSKDGDVILADLGNRTHALNPKITFMPTIMFNDAFDEKIQSESLKNLLKTVCKYLNRSVCKTSINLQTPVGKIELLECPQQNY